ncbi:hypothetical protein Syun_019911 [Stephania yunnanensis]|uniref:Uncharacterized protein n=1 Tax=Stephania yunnanensis TaxID=152371 RepID=A0AAP0IV24_9MAGN
MRTPELLYRNSLSTLSLIECHDEQYGLRTSHPNTPAISAVRSHDDHLHVRMISRTDTVLLVTSAPRIPYLSS